MDAFIQLLVDFGSLGMFVAAFLAGSFFPFSSEVVMTALFLAGTPSLDLLVWGTLGNVLGSLFNYGVGSLGREEWITRYCKVTPEKLERGRNYVRRYGPLAGLLGWVPLLGSVVTVALGFMRANIYLSMLYIAIGKFVRYWLLLYALQQM
ncbi:MAG: DedA family protein [Bacteroidaceae bacterium]|nr:DedA family protein [Bacteroidaceae bacterium]